MEGWWGQKSGRGSARRWGVGLASWTAGAEALGSVRELGMGSVLELGLAWGALMVQVLGSGWALEKAVGSAEGLGAAWGVEWAAKWGRAMEAG